MSNTYVIDSEIPSQDSNNDTEQERDMLECCLPGGFLNCSYGSWPKMGNCVGFMSTRCAGNWDQACDLYLGNLQSKDEGVNFLNETFKRKYCLASRSDSKFELGCGVECEQFNPNDPDTPGICYQTGMKGVYRNIANKNNDGLAIFDLYTNNSNLDPLDLVPCDQDVKCDISKADPNDPLIKRCLSYNACNVGSFVTNNSAENYEVASSSSSSKSGGCNFLLLLLIVALIFVGIRCVNCKKNNSTD